MRISDWSSDVCSSDLARLQIEIGTDRAAIECLDLGGLDTLSEYAFALGLERQPVDVAAEPRLAVPAIAILAVADLDLGKIEHDLIEFSPTLLFPKFLSRLSPCRRGIDPISTEVLRRRDRKSVVQGKGGLE